MDIEKENIWWHIRRHYFNSLFFKQSNTEYIFEKIKTLSHENKLPEVVRYFEFFLFEATSFFDIYLRYSYIISQRFRKRVNKSYEENEYKKIRRIYFSEKTFDNLKKNRQYFRLKKLYDYGSSKKKDDSYSLSRLVNYRNSIAHNSEIMEIAQSIKHNIKNRNKTYLPDNPQSQFFYEYTSKKEIELLNFCKEIIKIINKLQNNKNHYAVYFKKIT